MRRLPLLFLLALVAIVALAAPAAAHTELLQTTPAAGGSATADLRVVTVTFTEPVDARLATVAVWRRQGALVSTGSPRAAGTDLVQPVTALEASGYDVRWRAAAADGHILTGAFSFRAGAGTGAAGSGAAAAAPPERLSPAELLREHAKGNYDHDATPSYAISAADRAAAGRSRAARVAAPAAARAAATPLPAPPVDNSGTMIVALLGAAVGVTTLTAVWESARAPRV